MPLRDNTRAAAEIPGGRNRWLRHAVESAQRNWAQIARYLFTSVAVYILILLALYLFVDLAGVDATLAYVVIFLCAYVVDYTATLLLVFRRRHSWGNLGRFVLYVVLFLGISTALYDLFRAVGVHYLASALIVSALLMPLRFVANKHWVYR